MYKFLKKAKESRKAQVISLAIVIALVVISGGYLVFSSFASKRPKNIASEDKSTGGIAVSASEQAAIVKLVDSGVATADITPPDKIDGGADATQIDATAPDAQTDVTVTDPTDPSKKIVGAISPSNGSTGVELDVTPTITFSTDLLPDSITDKTVTVRKYADDSVLAAKVSYDLRVITIDLTAKLTGQTRYYIAVDGVTDPDGNAVTGATVKDKANNDFTTADVTSPTAKQTPADNKKAVSIATSVGLFFSEKLDPTSVGPGTIHIRKMNGDGIVPAKVVLNPSHTTVSVYPTQKLAYATRYYVEMNAAVKDVAGNSFGTSWTIPHKYAHDFTTVLIPLNQRAAQFAYSQSDASGQKHVVEHGNNDGKDVNAYQKAGGCGTGDPWCAAFISWSYQKAYAENPSAYGKPKLPKTCGALDLINFFGSNHHKYSISDNSHKPESGDVVYKPRSGGTGHVGIVYARSGSNIYVIEGNHQDRAAFIKYTNYGRDHWTKLGKW